MTVVMIFMNFVQKITFLQLFLLIFSHRKYRIPACCMRIDKICRNRSVFCQSKKHFFFYIIFASPPCFVSPLNRINAVPGYRAVCGAGG